MLMVVSFFLMVVYFAVMGDCWGGLDNYILVDDEILSRLNVEVTFLALLYHLRYFMCNVYIISLEVFVFLFLDLNDVSSNIYLFSLGLKEKFYGVV